MGTARVDARGNLVVTGFAVDPSYKKGAAAIFRLPKDGGFSTLVVENETLGESKTVHVREETGFFVMRCWDMDPNGKLIFADPSNRYAVVVGHPADGESKTIELPTRPTDEAALRRLAESTGWNGEYPKIVNLYWLDGGRFLVVPGADADTRVMNQLGTFEVFDEKGRSGGRHALRCDFDPAQDSPYIRNGLLVIIKGGKSANDAVYAQMAAMLGIKKDDVDAASETALESIRVDVYDLDAHFAIFLPGRN